MGSRARTRKRPSQSEIDAWWEELARVLGVKTPEQKELESEPVWQPFPGKPQEFAYYHPADELYYGGKAGGGKTDLLLGVAGTAQQNSLILRREFPRARAIIERSRQIFSRYESNHSKDSYNESLHIWRLEDEKTIEFGACQYEKDKEKYQGRAHDMKGFDEITEFTESQFRFINIWNRPLDDQADKDLRCRIVATGNPPTTAEGEWVMDYWGPFIDPDHPEPADHGSLVWYVRKETPEEGDFDVEIARTSLDDVRAHIETGKPIVRPTIEINGKQIEARSRSFISGNVEDNPVMMARGYDRQLDALPKELRDKFRHGIFQRITDSVDGQIIPTEWVVQAQDRWLEFMGLSKAEGRKLKTKEAISLFKQKSSEPQSAIGCDPARGGQDECCIAPVYGLWAAPLLVVEGKKINSGDDVALHVGSIYENDPIIKIDVIGIGASPYDSCRSVEDWLVVALNASKSAKGLTDRSKLLTFSNLRAYWIWSFMEMLDPQSGIGLMLPPDPRIKADLCSIRRAGLGGKTIIVESKDAIKKRLGRSPDRGEAIIYAFAPCLTHPLNTIQESSLADLAAEWSH